MHKFTASITAGLLSLTLATATQAEQFNLIDFIVLNEGIELAERDEYEAALAPIAAEYGAEVIHSYDVAAHLAGQMETAVRINVWNLEDPAALSSIDQNADYQALTPDRDRIHDLDALTLYMGEEISNAGPIESGFILIDLVVMKDGFGDAERDEYQALMEPIAERYGYTVQASYRIVHKIAGDGPESPLRLIFWHGDSPDGLGSGLITNI